MIVGMGEQWSKIAGLPWMYEVSNLGRVRRLAYAYATSFRGKPVSRPPPGKVFRLESLSTKGYPRVNLCGAVHAVHRLVADAFIPNPHELAQVNHKNGVKTDNRAANLEWVTNQGNRDHAVKAGLHPRGSQISKVLTEADIPRIRALAADGVSQRTIAAAYGVCQQTISHVVRRSTWPHVKG